MNFAPGAFGTNRSGTAVVCGVMRAGYPGAASSRSHQTAELFSASLHIPGDGHARARNPNDLYFLQVTNRYIDRGPQIDERSASVSGIRSQSQMISALKIAPPNHCLIIQDRNYPIVSAADGGARDPSLLELASTSTSGGFTGYPRCWTYAGSSPRTAMRMH